MTNHPHLIPGALIKGLIFDLDGTLADTMSLHIDSWKIVGQAFKANITEKMITDRAGTPTIQVVEQLNDLYGWLIDPAEFRIKKNETYIALKEKMGKIQPVQHVVSIAEKYHGSLPMSIGTGSIKRNARLAIEDLGIGEWFETLVTAEDVKDPKPHPETFLKCAEAMGVDPVDCMVYEDGPPGIQAALSAGMIAVNVDTFEIYRP